MKTIYTLLLTTLATASWAQLKMSSETKQSLNKIYSSVEANSNTKDLIKNLERYPIYRVNGEYCLSTISKVAPEFTEEDLGSLAYVGSRIGDVVTIKIPLQNTIDVALFKNVEYLEVAERINPENNKMIADVRADSVWQGIGLNQPYTGKNVLIGVTDWGFDYDHPMFMDTTLSQSRIRAAWDQFKFSGDTPANFNYGVEYDTPSELDAANSDTAGTYYDYATHGSHVAGIAGGSGAGTQYRGVAFESEFLFNSIQLDVGSAIDAFAWMQEIADLDQKRLVINMSWGLYYMGTMDGTSLVSQAINTMSSQGVIFVTSAGNNGSVNFHVKKEYNNDSIRSRIQIYNYANHPSMWGQSVSMWGEVGESFGSILEVYNGTGDLVDSSRPFFTQMDEGYHDTIMVIGNDTVFYNLTIDSAHALNNRPHIRLRVKNEQTNLRIILNSFAPSGTVHYWNVVELSNGVGNWGQALSTYGNNGVAGDSEYSIGEPACTESAITVAAHISEIVAGNGNVYPGSSANFSSHGPTYDERLKPDISAPGASVVSSINSYTTVTYTPSATINFNGRDYDFAAYSGTSMASPACAGVVALILEANPWLTNDDVKDILKLTARADNKTGVIPTNGSYEWGWGKVTATEAVLMAQNFVSVEDPISEQEFNVFPNPVTDILYLSNEFHLSSQVEIYSISGEKVFSGNIQKQQGINTSDWANGVYIIHVANGSQKHSAKFMKL